MASSSPKPKDEDKKEVLNVDLDIPIGDSGRYSLGIDSGRSMLSLDSGRALLSRHRETSYQLPPAISSSPKFISEKTPRRSPLKGDTETIVIDFGTSPEDQKTNFEEGGVSLTWEDVSVSVSNGKEGQIAILNGLTGFAVPGEVLAIMGPSGCGKTTLLDTLAGRLPFNVQQKGEILINGRKQKLAYGTSAYVTQDDVLLATLTVREAVYYSAQIQLPDSVSDSEKKERAETTIREMGLESVMDTRIGGWASKGISGGQKRRVSICFEILTRPQLLFLDEPTSGLDSAASFHVMSRIKRLARHERMTVVAAVHQPSSEVFELFDGLCLLAYGETVFFGPSVLATEFFAANGFPCPPLRNPSDHFLRTINKDFDKDRQEDTDSQLITTTQAIEILTSSYSSSLYSDQVARQISEIREKGGASVKKVGQSSFFTQIDVLTRRSLVNMYRDLGYYWLRLIMYIGIGIGIGTIYYDVGYSYGSIQARGAALIFITAFLTFMSVSGFPSFVEEMKVFERERLNGHYGVSAYTIANLVSSTPFLGLISVIPGAIVYYLVKFQSSGDHFIYFALVLFTSMMLVEGMMMIIASMIPSYLMGLIIGAGIQGLMVLSCGFFRLPDDLPRPVWKYPLYYIAFHRYASQGFYKNEFLGLSFPSGQAGGNTTISGAEVLTDYWQMEMGYSKLVDLYVLIGMMVLYRVIFVVILKITEKMKKNS